MNYKLLSVLIIISTLFMTSFGCVFMEDSQGCVIAQEGSNIYQIDTTQLGSYKEISATILVPGTSADRFKLEILEETSNSVTFFQNRPFNDFGVYTLRVEVVLEDEITTLTRNFEILYDKSVPMPPVIESVDTSSSGNELIIIGFVNNPALGGDVLVYVDGGSTPRVAPVQEGGSFEITGISHSDTLRLELTHRVQRQHTSELVESSRNRQIYYSENIRQNHFTNPSTATVNSINWGVNDNPNSFEDGSRIVTYTPHYYISGQAQDGNVVYIQGAPVPVIDGRFHTYVLLNEASPLAQGTDVSRLCINGRSIDVNTHCRDFKVIYSHAFGDNPFSLVDEERLRTLNLDNVVEINAFRQVSSLEVQGIDTRNVAQAINPSFSQIDRNLFLVEVKYPGLHEYQYLMVDSKRPQIEFVTDDNLFRSSKVGVIIKDDTQVNLQSFELSFGGVHTLRYNNATRVINGGGKVYLEFNVPEVTNSLLNFNLEASITDVYGNTSSNETRISSLRSEPDRNDLIINLQSQGTMFGNRIFMTPQTSEVRLQIINKDPQMRNMPITTGILRAGGEIITTFTQSQNRELLVTIDADLLKNFGSNLIELELNMFRSLEDSQPSITTTQTLEVLFLERELDSTKRASIIANNVNQDNLVIVKFNTSFIDYSSFNTQNINFKGDYGFVNLNSATSTTLTYKDMAGNSYNLQIPSMKNTNLRLNPVANTQDYQTVNVVSNSAYHFFDLFLSSRSQNLLSSGIQTRENIHYNPLYLEGISRSLFSVFDTSNRQTFVQMAPLQERFSFNSYPTSSFQYDLGTGINEIQFRGFRSHFNNNEVTTVIQGRVLGDEEVVSARLGFGQGSSRREVQCLMEERFFVCEIEIEPSRGQDMDFEFRDSGGNPVEISYNSLSLNLPTGGTLQGNTSRAVEYANTAFFRSGLGEFSTTKDVSDLITCRRVSLDNASLNSDLIYFEEDEGTGNITIFRDTSQSIAIRLECSVSYNSITKTKEFAVEFNDMPQEKSVILNTPTELGGGTTLEVNGSVDAKNFRGDNLTHLISCTSPSENIRVNQEIGSIHVERLKNISIETQVNCFVEDPLTGDNASKSFPVTFSEIKNQSLLQLHVQKIISGGKNQQVVLSGDNFVALYGSFHSYGRVTCSISNPNPGITQEVVDNNLVITRTNNQSLVAQLRCQLSYEGYETVETTSIILFDRVNDPTLEYTIDLDVSTPLDGKKTDNVFDEIRASDSLGNDLTSQITCSPHSSLTTGVLVTQSHSPLIIQRTTLEEIHTFVTCLVSNNGVSEMKHVEIKFDDASDSRELELTISAQTPLVGRQKESASGSIEARLNGVPELTSQIECSIPNPSELEYNINHVQNSITFTRLNPNSISQIVTCSYTNIDGSKSVSTDIQVSFDLQEPPVDLRLDVERDLYIVSGYQFKEGITATLDGENVIDDISCRNSGTTSSVSVDIEDGRNLVVTRDFDDEAMVPITCRYTPTSQDIRTFNIKFEEIVVNTNYLHLNIDSSILIGGDSQTTSVGISAIYNGYSVLHEVTCTSPNEIIQSIDGNYLNVTRTTNISIDADINCQVSVGGLQNSSKTRVLFNTVNDPTPGTPRLFLEVPSVLNGNMGNSVQAIVSANNSDGENLTSQIQCITPQASSPITIESQNSPLKISRNTNSAIESYVKCSISQGSLLPEEKFVAVLFDEKDDGVEPPTSVFFYAQNPLYGGEANQAIAHVEAFIVQSGVDITSNIVCQNLNPSLISHVKDSSSQSVTVTRLTDDLIDSAIIRCTLDEADSQTTITRDIVVFFDKRPDDGGGNGGGGEGPVTPQQITITPSPVSLISSTNTATTQLEVLRGDENAIDDITCRPSSLITQDINVQIDLENSRLVVTRNIFDKIEGSVICSDDVLEEDIKTIPLLFSEMSAQEIVQLNVPGNSNLGTSQMGIFSITGSIVGQSEYISDEIECVASSTQVNLEHDYNSDKLDLKIIRNSDDEINSIISCSLRGTTRTFSIKFEKIEDFEVSLIRGFPGSPQRLGQTLGGTFYMNAQNSNSLDITNLISCESSNSNIRISPSNPQRLSLDGKLEVSRLSNESLQGTILCQVDDGEGNTDSKELVIIFDKIGDSIIPSLPEISISLDPSKSNLISTTSPFTFSSGNLVFNVDAPFPGTYRLFMGGTLVKTISHPTLEFTITPDDYLNLNLDGEFDVFVRDETLESEPIRMRFARLYQAIVSIIIS